jgi:hypothetical protein
MQALCNWPVLGKQYVVYTRCKLACLLPHKQHNTKIQFEDAASPRLNPSSYDDRSGRYHHVFIVEGYDELDDLVELAEAGKGEHERLSRTEQFLSNSISFGNSITSSHSLPCMLVKQAPH